MLAGSGNHMSSSRRVPLDQDPTINSRRSMANANAPTGSGYSENSSSRRVPPIDQDPTILSHRNLLVVSSGGASSRRVMIESNNVAGGSRRGGLAASPSSPAQRSRRALSSSLGPTQASSRRLVTQASSRRMLIDDNGQNKSSRNLGQQKHQKSSRRFLGGLSLRSLVGGSDDGLSILEKTQEERLEEALAEGAYHLPGNESWCKDFGDYFKNNHPLLAPFLQHRLHPISRCMRFVGLLGSILFGLAMTNLIFIFFMYGKDDYVYFTMSAGGFEVTNGTSFTYLDENGVAKEIADTATGVDVSNGMIILWTVGGVSHAIYDELVWHATACNCASPGGRFEWLYDYKHLGSLFVIVSVILITLATTLIVWIRMNIEHQDEEAIASLANNTGINATNATAASTGITSDAVLQTNFDQLTDASSYEFLVAYGIELAVAWFLYFPLAQTILFTGILGCCGSIPLSCIGGRPYEVKKERQELEEAMKKKNQLSNSKDTDDDDEASNSSGDDDNQDDPESGSTMRPVLERGKSSRRSVFNLFSKLDSHPTNVEDDDKPQPTFSTEEQSLRSSRRSLLLNRQHSVPASMLMTGSASRDSMDDRATSSVRREAFADLKRQQPHSITSSAPALNYQHSPTKPNGSRGVEDAFGTSHTASASSSSQLQLSLPEQHPHWGNSVNGSNDNNNNNSTGSIQIDDDQDMDDQERIMDGLQSSLSITLSQSVPGGKIIEGGSSMSLGIDDLGMSSDARGREPENAEGGLSNSLSRTSPLSTLEEKGLASHALSQSAPPPPTPQGRRVPPSRSNSADSLRNLQSQSRPQPPPAFPVRRLPLRSNSADSYVIPQRPQNGDQMNAVPSRPCPPGRSNSANNTGSTSCLRQPQQGSSTSCSKLSVSFSLPEDEVLLSPYQGGPLPCPPRPVPPRPIQPQHPNQHHGQRFRPESVSTCVRESPIRAASASDSCHSFSKSPSKARERQQNTQASDGSEGSTTPLSKDREASSLATPPEEAPEFQQSAPALSFQHSPVRRPPRRTTSSSQPVTHLPAEEQQQHRTPQKSETKVAAAFALASSKPKSPASATLYSMLREKLGDKESFPAAQLSSSPSTSKKCAEQETERVGPTKENITAEHTDNGKGDGADCALQRSRSPAKASLKDERGSGEKLKSAPEKTAKRASRTPRKAKTEAAKPPYKPLIVASPPPDSTTQDKLVPPSCLPGGMTSKDLHVMYNPASVTKTQFGLLLEYIVSGRNRKSPSSDAERSEIRARAANEVRRYKEYEKTKDQQQGGGDGTADNGGDCDGEWWHLLDDHDKRKVYKRARQVLDAL